MRISGRNMKVITFACVMLLAAALGGASSLSQPLQDSQLLAPNQPVERSLVSGQAHAYLINLQADQYLSVGVTQRGVNVGLNLFVPDQQQLSQINNQDYIKDVETITLVAESSGRYRLVVLQLSQARSRDNTLLKSKNCARPGRKTVTAHWSVISG